MTHVGRVRREGIPEYLTISEVADMHRVTKVAVLYAIRRKAIPATLARGQWWIVRAAAEAYRPRAYVRRAPGRPRPKAPEKAVERRSVKVRVID